MSRKWIERLVDMWPVFGLDGVCVGTLFRDGHPLDELEGAVPEGASHEVLYLPPETPLKGRPRAELRELSIRSLREAADGVWGFPARWGRRLAKYSLAVEVGRDKVLGTDEGDKVGPEDFYRWEQGVDVEWVNQSLPEGCRLANVPVCVLEAAYRAWWKVQDRRNEFKRRSAQVRREAAKSVGVTPVRGSTSGETFYE